MDKFNYDVMYVIVYHGLNKKGSLVQQLAPPLQSYKI